MQSKALPRIGQVISERAEQSVKGAAADWRYVSERLVRKGIIDQREADRVSRELNEVLVMPTDLKTKLSLAKRLVTNSIVGYGLPAAERGIESLITGE
jgi:hypothetical protein